MFTVPTILKLLVEHESAGRFDHSSLRYVIYAGAPMYREDQKRALAVLGPVLVQYFGLGEVTGAITVLPTRLHAAEDGPEVRLGTCGFDRTGMQLQVQGEDGRALAPLRDRRDLRHRPGGLRRLLRQPRGQREGVPGRLVPHRRPRARRRAGLPLHHRPRVGHVHLRRLQRLSARDRGEDPDPPRCHRGRRRRRARPALGRGRHRRLRRHRARSARRSSPLSSTASSRATSCRSASSSGRRCRSRPTARSPRSWCARSSTGSVSARPSGSRRDA